MPKKKVKVKVASAFTHRLPGEHGSRLFAPGEHELDYKVAKQLKEEGRVSFTGDDDDEETAPEATTQEHEGGAPGETEVPEDFPKRDILAENGYDTMEKIRDANHEDLLEIEGIGDATLNNIGNAVDEFFKGKK